MIRSESETDPGLIRHWTLVRGGFHGYTSSFIAFFSEFSQIKLSYVNQTALQEKLMEPGEPLGEGRIRQT